MKKVLAFGSFDPLHEGHIDFFRQARALGDRLTVVVARDQAIRDTKMHEPLVSEEVRRAAVQNARFVDEVMFGSETPDPYQLLGDLVFDIVAVGYDQAPADEKIRRELDRRGKAQVTIVRLKPFQPEKYKSTFLRYSTAMASLETATLAAGCFWCTEALFKRLKGVESVMSGYSGGQKENPSYEQVSSEKTGHAEAIQITFDPAVISYEKILEVFWKTHDPTTLNQQGADMGTQYRSTIFYHNEMQQKIAEDSKQKAQDLFDEPIVTEIIPFTKFYEAEGDQQDFYEKNPQSGYCKVVIDPKINKLLKNFKENIKDEYTK